MKPCKVYIDNAHHHCNFLFYRPISFILESLKHSYVVRRYVIHNTSKDESELIASCMTLILHSFVTIFFFFVFIYFISYIVITLTVEAANGDRTRTKQPKICIDGNRLVPVKSNKSNVIPLLM